MISQDSFPELEDFARQCIDSQNYPKDIHLFTRFVCSACKSPALRLTIEHHTGSEQGDFKGILWGECSACGYLGRLFTFTGESRKPLREERPVCDCGGRDFQVGMCERTEGEEGIPRFFDEGVIVGRCIQCHRNRAFVFTD